MPAATAQRPQALSFQGIVVPGSSYDPVKFKAGTRRERVLQRTIASWAGFGNTDTVSALRSGILSGYYVKVSGTLTVTPGTGAVATTPAWPYGILRSARFQANGQSNLVNASGWALRARELMRNTRLTDRGVTRGVGGASPGTSVSQGTLSLNSESWGVGQNVTAIPGAAYDVELSFFIPVAYEDVNLTGAIFCQTLSTSLELNLDWANLTDLFTLTGNGAVSFSPTVTVEAVNYTIPSDGQGGMFLPDLSAFHSFIETKAPNSIAVGNNEIVLSGQGVGRTLLSVLWRVLNGSPPAPLIPGGPAGGGATPNITQPYWRYGSNTTPETFLDGTVLREHNERKYGSDIAALAGYQAIDFDETNAFRDAVDESSATELRFGFTIANGVVLTTPSCSYVQDVILQGAAA